MTYVFEKIVKAPPCSVCGISTTWVLTLDEYQDWKNRQTTGKTSKEIFPEASQDLIMEFMDGIHPKCWAKAIEVSE